MKRLKRIGILAAVLAVLCIATALLTLFEEKQEQILASDTVIFTLSPDSVQSLRWQYDDGQLSFQKTDDGWRYDGDSAFPVSTDKINGILERFQSFGAQFIISHVEDYGQYGLDEPECTVELKTDSKTYTIRLGTFSLLDQQRYVDIGDGNVYLVSDDPMDSLYTSLSDMIAHDSLPSLSYVTGLQFSGSHNYSIARNEENDLSYSADDIWFTERNSKSVPLNTAAVTQYLNTVASLDLLEYVTYAATETELESFGLNDPELTVALNYSYENSDGSTTAETVKLHISQNPAEKLAAQQADEDSAPTVTKYVRLGDSPIVYILDDVDYGILAAAGYNDLRHGELFWGDTEQITKMEILLEGETHLLTSTPGEGEDALRTWSFSGEDVDASGVLSALSALTAESFTDAKPSGKEEIQLTLTLDSQTVPTVTIHLFRQDGAVCLAQLDGQTVSYVSRSAAVSLIEAIQSIVLR